MSNDWKPADTLANRLRLVRATMGITQRELAELTNVSIGVIQGIEDGRSPRNESVVIKKIAFALRVDRVWLMDGGPLNAESPSGDDPKGQDAPGVGAGRKGGSNLYKGDGSNVYPLQFGERTLEGVAA